MIIGLEKMESSLLMLTNDLDSISQRYASKIPKDERDDFQDGIKTIREEMFRMLEAGKKAREVIAKLY